MAQANVGDTGMVDVLTAGSSWVFCSIGMMVFNKLAVDAIPEAALLVSFQLAATAAFMVVFAWKSLHIGSFYDLLRWSRVAPFFAGVLLSSMFGLKNAPMSLVIVFRGLAPLFSIAVEVFYPEPYTMTAATSFSPHHLVRRLNLSLAAPRAPGKSLVPCLPIPALMATRSLYERPFRSDHHLA